MAQNIVETLSLETTIACVCCNSHLLNTFGSYTRFLKYAPTLSFFLSLGKNCRKVSLLFIPAPVSQCLFITFLPAGHTPVGSFWTISGKDGRRRRFLIHCVIISTKGEKSWNRQSTGMRNVPFRYFMLFPLH